MQRYDFYFRQPVSEDEMDDAFDGVENALFNLMVDTGLVGVLANAVVTEHSPNDVSVDVSGSAVVYDKAGQRIAWGPVQNVDVSTDYLDVSTAVATPGNEKIVSLFAKFDRTLSDARVDGNSATVYWDRAETFDFYITQGSETASPPATPPALNSEYILLADIRRSYNDNTITNADITGPTGTYTAITDRREDAFVLTSGSVTLRAGTPEEIAQELLSQLNDAENIPIAVVPNWADGSGITATDVENAVEEIVSDLSSSASGSKKIGSPATTQTWADSTVIAAGGADGVWGQIDDIVGVLGDKVGATACGAYLVGSDAHTAAGNGLIDLAQGSVRSQLEALSNSSCKHDGAQTVSGDWTVSGAWDFTGDTSFSGDVEFDTFIAADADGGADIGMTDVSSTRFARRPNMIAQRFQYYEEQWVGGDALTDFPHWEQSASSDAAPVVPANTNRGMVYCQTPAVSSQSSGIGHKNASFGDGDVFVFEWVFAIDNITNVKVTFGFSANETGHLDDGVSDAAVGCRFDPGSSSKFTLFADDGTVTTDNGDTTDVAATTIYRITIETTDGSDAKLYVNGALEASLPTSAIGVDQLRPRAWITTATTASRRLTIYNFRAWSYAGG